MKFRRSVVYEIDADSLEYAGEVWGDDGPELPTVSGVSAVDMTDIVAFDAEVDE